MSVLILALLATLYFQYAKTVMLSSQRLAMQLESESYVPKLKQWLENDRNISTFPKDLAYSTALYGYDQKPIVSKLHTAKINFKENIYLSSKYVYLIIPLSPYEMGEYYLIFETRDDGLWQQQTLEITLISGAILFLMLVGVGFFLSRLILRPMNEAIALLDDFIKDTTHELNTPVSAILTNIEALETTEFSPSVQKKIKRIEIASRTISTLYDDLTYLVLNHDLAIENTKLDLTLLLHERLEYFRHRIEQKKISLELNVHEQIYLTIDTTKATRLIDNLLSNAIKYNTIGGEIFITLNEGILCIKDNGIGIPESMIERVFERYTRADKSVGGFGIGLNIVAMIAKDYNLQITIDSEEKKGTKICVGWE
ncbi:MAG: HAMP domain-containing sensor histidine kinase [Sulfuricurvum sp.]|nr:HAMP domain-containing sensor histidine kinase [Sulfuricurvum sp.]